MLFFQGGMDILNPRLSVQKALATVQNDLSPGLVIINTLRKVFTASANDSETPTKVYGTFQHLFPQAALLFVHHDRKLQAEHTKDMEREDLSGSLAWANDAQVTLHLVKHGKHPGLVRMDHTGSQASELHPPLILEIAEDGSHVSAHGEETLRQVRLILVGLAPGTPSREKDRAVAEGLGCSERHARTLRIRAEAV
jgi:hypothetical protein